MKLDDHSHWRTQTEAFPQDNEPAFRGDPYALPIPNASLREASSIADIHLWYSIGEAWAHIASHFLPAHPCVLDIGCGCGKMARFFYLDPNLRYIGIDIFLPAILWCKQSFQHLAKDRFHFEHYDGRSRLYNPNGSIEPSEYRLPVEDSSIDMTVCASLFTHLLEPECRHFLGEIGRVAKVGGQALVSIHDEPPAGQRFSGDETRIDIDREYFLDLARDNGLSLRKTIGNVYGQHLVLLQKDAETDAPGL